MNVSDYNYYYTYLKELEIYYESVVKKYRYSKLVKICKEIERLNRLLKKSTVIKLSNK